MDSDRIEELCQDMDSLARQTWKNYEEGSGVGLAPGEESTTDSVLLDLWRVSGGILHVNKFTRHQERRNGADWEWWVGSATDGWLRLRVQAKRIYEQHYQRLDHRDKETGVYQYETLIQGCAQDSYFLRTNLAEVRWRPRALRSVRSPNACRGCPRWGQADDAYDRPADAGVTIVLGEGCSRRTCMVVGLRDR